MTNEESTLTVVVGDTNSNQRADKFLSESFDDISRSRLKALMTGGAVLLNGNPLTSPSHKVSEGDVFSVRIPPAEPSEPEAEDIPLNILYEDDDVIILNKQEGLVVHPGAGNWAGTLVNALLYHCGDRLSGIGGVVRPGIVHRLDKDTSGVMIVAKNDHAHQHLSQQLSDRSLSRVYHALVLGVPMPVKGKVDRPIGRHRHNRLKMSVMSNAPKEACTYYKVLKSYGEAAALLECKLETGRTHQIRVHMEAIGVPLIGDPLYGPQNTALISKFKKEGYNNELIKELIDFPRQILHAKQIRFIHPTQEKEMVFDADMPSDIVNMLKNMDK